MIENIGLFLSSSCTWGEKYFGVLMIMLEFLATLVMAAYYWDWLLHIAPGPAVALFLYFCISSAASGYLRVFVSGIFPCRPVLLTLGLGHSVGLDESLRALAQIPAQCKPLGIVPSCIVFVRILFLYCYIFCFAYLCFDPGTDPSSLQTTWNIALLL